jgi:hypothetical protein
MKVYPQWLFAFIQLSVAVEAAADSGRQDVVTLISQCEGRTRGEALAAGKSSGASFTTVFGTLLRDPADRDFRS